MPRFGRERFYLITRDALMVLRRPAMNAEHCLFDWIQTAGYVFMFYVTILLNIYRFDSVLNLSLKQRFSVAISFALDILKVHRHPVSVQLHSVKQLLN